MEDKSEKTYLLPAVWKPGKTSPGDTTTTTTTNTAIIYGGTNVGSDGEEDGLVCSGQHGRAQSGLSVLLASFFLVAQVSGLGVLALPWAVAQTGWAGLGVVVASGVLVGVAAVHLGTSWIILEERWPQYQRACRKPYPAMALRSLGVVGWHIANVVQGVTLFGVSTVTILLSAQLLESILTTSLPQIGVCSWLLVCGVVLIPLSWLSSPKEFWPASVLALIATVAACVVVVVKILVEEGTPGKEAQHPAPTLYSFFLGFGTMLFSYGGAITFPTIQNDMRDRSKFPLAVVISFVALLVMYLPLAALGYQAFGSGVQVNILLSVSGPVVTTVQVLMLVNTVFTFLMLINPLSQSLEEALNLPTAFGWRRCVTRTTLVLLGVLISLAVKNFGTVLNLMGSFAVPLLTFIFPPIFYIRLCDSGENDNWPKRTVTMPHRVFLWSLVGVGAVSMVIATWVSIQSLLESVKDMDSCFAIS
ncbi:hypothetical protein Pmani_003299 [Petrolisthes manimaculis]|uniref:Amino acid transporter transmembrane domain-containing protein n=1 Tax=Petrolisthes manimaculis TaxID=1843537 RepID=A0AAE1QGX6_9EUCA|nr:hypothetical protein Pmani_003299 [Petrolisthes manimaculis]